MDCISPGSSICGDSPGKNTGVGVHAHLQGIFPGIEPRSPTLQVDSSPSEPLGKPSSNFLVASLGLLMYSILSSSNSDSFITCFIIWILFISFSFLIAKTKNCEWKRWLVDILSWSSSKRWWFQIFTTENYVCCELAINGLYNVKIGLPGYLSWSRIYLQCRRSQFNSWVRKIPWKWDKLPTWLSW